MSDPGSESSSSAQPPAYGNGGEPPTGPEEPAHEEPLPEPKTKGQFVRETLTLAWPLILSSMFWSIQVTVDAVLLARYDPNAVAASFMVVVLFWLPFCLLQATAGYSTTFVAQYLGAGQNARIGPVVWQAVYFSVAGGLLFLLYWPFAGDIFKLIGHAPAVQSLEVIYFRCMCFSALPGLVVAAVSGFFAGRGDSVTVMVLNASGLAVNAVLDYVLIFGHFGFPEMGIAGAGWATVVGMSVSAVLGVLLFLRKKYREEFNSLGGWRLDLPLFGRLMRYGLPAGMQWFLEMSAFTAFTIMLGWYGEAEFAASSIAFRINMLAFLPMLGMGQAVAVLVGQRLGQDRDDLASKSVWTAFVLCWLYMSTVAFLYVAWPSLFTTMFRGDLEASQWATIDLVVKRVMIFMAIYSLFDSLNMVFSFALRGAGDTFFVSVVSLGLSWPLMVAPSYYAYTQGWSLYWLWGFASAYIIIIGLILLLRFLTGKWRSMRVIEPAMT